MSMLTNYGLVPAPVVQFVMAKSDGGDGINHSTGFDDLFALCIDWCYD